jgi:hypothetical protein
MVNEEYLQEQSELGKHDKGLDSLAYQKVFDALKKESTAGLSPEFADKVMLKLQTQSTSRSSGFELLLALIGGLFCIIVLIVAVVLTGFKVQLGFLESLHGYKGVFIFGIVFIIFLHWIDKVVIRKKLSV